MLTGYSNISALWTLKFHIFCLVTPLSFNFPQSFYIQVFQFLLRRYSNIFPLGPIRFRIFCLVKYYLFNLPRSFYIQVYCHDITEILLKVALNTIKQTNIHVL